MIEHHSCPFASRAVRALVLLHNEHLRRFLPVWKRAREANAPLPASSDPAYASLDTLGRNVLGAAGGYATWVCDVLQLPAAGIRSAPEAAAIPDEADRYLEHVLARWNEALRSVRDDQLETPEYPSRWGTRYSIDAMLEHAVMHPIRHTFQLEELLEERPTGLRAESPRPRTY